MFIEGSQDTISLDKIVFLAFMMVMSQQRVNTLIIRVFNVCHLGVTSIQRVNEYIKRGWGNGYRSHRKCMIQVYTYPSIVAKDENYHKYFHKVAFLFCVVHKYFHKVTFFFMMSANSYKY